MFIGSLLKEISQYYYTRKYSDVICMPDLFVEQHTDSMFQNGQGKLLNGEIVGWNWMTVLEEGIDVHITFKDKIFLDHIFIKQGEGSAFRSIEALTYDDSQNIKKLGAVQSETGGLFKKREANLYINFLCTELVIRIHTACIDFSIEKFDIFGFLEDGIFLFPQPDFCQCLNKKSIAVDKFKLICGDQEDQDIQFASKLLQEKFQAIFGREILIQDNAQGKGFIRLEKRQEMTLNGGETQKLGQNAFGLRVEEWGCILFAHDRLGMIYAAETLLTLMTHGEVPTIEIFDKPYMQFRGFHMGLPSRENIKFYKRFIKYCLVPLRYNTLFIQVSGALKYEKHPEIYQQWCNICEMHKQGKMPRPPHMDMLCDGSYLTKSELAEITEYAKSFGLEVIPEIQSMGHVQYLTMSHPEIAEMASEVQNKQHIQMGDQMLAKEYYHCYCPSNEKSYELLFDVIDEIVETMQPERYVHMGHDEIYEIGLCDKCRQKTPSQLLAQDINRIYDYLGKKGLKMMIWGDMLQDVTEYHTAEAINMIPKDIVLLDFIWYFHPQKDIEDHLLSHGFQVIMGNMYSSHYPRFKERASKKNVIGAQISTWTQVSEYRYASTGKIFDMIFSSNMMWSRHYCEQTRVAYNKIIGDKILPMLRQRLRGILTQPPRIYVSVPLQTDLPKICNCLKTMDRNDCGDIPFSVYSPISVSGRHAVNCLNTCSTICKDIPCCSGIAFLHAVENTIKRVPRGLFENIGKYVVHYQDGTKVEIDLEYGGNIFALHKKFADPFLSFYYRHEGYIGTYFSDPAIKDKDPSGGDLTLYCYEWENPYAHKPISKITMHAEGESGVQISIFAVTAIKDRPV